MKTKFLIIMIIIFIAELVVEGVAFPNTSDPNNSKDDGGSNFGEGLLAVFLLFFIYPVLIILSSMILCLSCNMNNPKGKIVVCIILCILKGLAIIVLLSYNKLVIFGIILEILNLIFLITSIIYQSYIKNKFLL